MLGKTGNPFPLTALCAAKIVNSGNTASRNLGKKVLKPVRPMECAIVHAVVSSARAVVSTVHGVDSRRGRGLKGFVQGMLDVGLCGLCKEIAQKVAKTAKKVKEKKGPSLAHHAVRQ